MRNSSSSWRAGLFFAAPLVLGFGAAGAATEADASGRPTGTVAVRERADLDGLSVELSMTVLERPTPSRAQLQEGDIVRFSFAFTDSATSTPLSGVFPAAWMDLRLPDEAGDRARCVDRVEMLLGGSILAKPELDLNVYFVVALNDDSTITIVDPLFGFGGTQLLAMVDLGSPGEDWALDAQQRRLYVSLPAADAVAVVDTEIWQVIEEIPVPVAPTRLAIQPDGSHLWAAYGAGEEWGVAVISTDRFEVVARIPTGLGEQDLVLGPDDRFAFASGAESGTVTVIDVARRQVVKRLATGTKPSTLAWSEIAGAVYVGHLGEGGIVAIDGERHEILARMPSAPGLTQIRFAPSGRMGFGLIPELKQLLIFDTAINRVVQKGEMWGSPVQVAFTDEVAYVLHDDTEIVLMVPLDSIGAEGQPIQVVDFPGGRLPFGAGRSDSLASAMARAPGANAMLVANPADETVYYYKEGMAAPMGSFQNYGHQPRAVLVVDRSLEETATGVYETVATLRRPGAYDVALFVDAPRTVECFEVEVAPDPGQVELREWRPLIVRPLTDDTVVETRRQARLTFEAIDPNLGVPRDDLADLEVRLVQTPGHWHAQQLARNLGGGRYEAAFDLPQSGLYYVYVRAPSAGLIVDNTPGLYLVVPVEESTGTAAEDDASHAQ